MHHFGIIRVAIPPFPQVMITPCLNSTADHNWGKLHISTHAPSRQSQYKAHKSLCLFHMNPLQRLFRDLQNYLNID